MTMNPSETSFFRWEVDEMRPCHTGNRKSRGWMLLSARTPGAGQGDGMAWDASWPLEQGCLNVGDGCQNETLLHSRFRPCALMTDRRFSGALQASL
jgi:hypothetical protein